MQAEVAQLPDWASGISRWWTTPDEFWMVQSVVELSNSDLQEFCSALASGLMTTVVWQGSSLTNESILLPTEGQAGRWAPLCQCMNISFACCAAYNVHLCNSAVVLNLYMCRWSCVGGRFAIDIVLLYPHPVRALTTWYVRALGMQAALCGRLQQRVCVKPSIHGLRARPSHQVAD